MIEQSNTPVPALHNHTRITVGNHDGTGGLRGPSVR